MFARHGTDAHANLKLELCSTAWDMPGSYLEVGGAGGIRTHEWRFCRPLPWATWVPRRTFKYSKNPDDTAMQHPRAALRAIYFFSAPIRIFASRKNRADSSGGVGLM